MGGAGRVEVRPPAVRELTKLRIIALAVHAEDHVTKPAPRGEPTVHGDDDGWLGSSPLEPHESQGSHEQGTAAKPRFRMKRRRTKKSPTVAMSSAKSVTPGREKMF